jgi:predicted dehydrogenase
MSPQRIAVVGAGLIGRAHIEAIAQTPGLQLSALVDTAESARTLADLLGVSHFTNLDALLSDDPPDGVVIATPNALHVPQALKCIYAEVPCLVEKPIAPTVQEAQTLVEAVARTSAKVLIGHHRAHSAIMREAVQTVQSGALGQLVAVMGSAAFYKPDAYFEAGPWRRKVGGGPILLNLIHEIHNLRMLCGEVDTVQAMASHRVRGFAVEDTVAINLQFVSGTLGTFILSDTAASTRSWEQTSQENKAYAHDPVQDCYELMGTHGSLSVPTLRWRYFADPGERSWMNPMVQKHLSVTVDDPLVKQMAHFASVMQGEAAPLVSAADGLANLRVTQAIAQSARTFLPVHLQDFDPLK